MPNCASASKLFPSSAHRDRRTREAEQRTDLINAANINTLPEQTGQRAELGGEGGDAWTAIQPKVAVPNPTARRDKRLPFSTEQLQALFWQPLYTGCRDGEHGYAVRPARPRNARFWIPLVSMFGGLRLSEACQLDVADIRRIEDVDYFAITEERSDEGTTDEATQGRYPASASSRSTSC